MMSLLIILHKKASLFVWTQIKSLFNWNDKQAVEN